MKCIIQYIHIALSFKMKMVGTILRAEVLDRSR